MAHALAHPDGEPAVQGLRGADGVSDAGEIREGRCDARTEYVAGISNRGTVIRHANARTNIRKTSSANKGSAYPLVGIDKTCQVHSLGHRKVQISGVVTIELLFVANVRSVDRKSTRLNSSHRCISYA